MAAGDEHFQAPLGAIDGINQDFTVNVAYAAGTLRVWQNGVLTRQADDDGWDETGSTTFRTKEPFRIGSTIHVRYIEA
jgi:hypothetical protein